MSVLLGVRSETEADRAETWRHQIAAGPWVYEFYVVGRRCHLCEEFIWLKAFVRPGDDLSPALYRHDICHHLTTGEDND